MEHARQATVRANGVDFHYYEQGEGPLALCLHGFPDSPWTYRYLLPALAAAGFRAVAPFMRGYAPTSAPADGRYDMYTIAQDYAALHTALCGDARAVMIAHDWGAVAAYIALAQFPEQWSRAVIVNIPPMPVFGEIATTYDQIKRLHYIWFFQMDCAAGVVAADDFAFIERLWGDWSPGYDATADLVRAKACLREPAHLDAALGYYHAAFNPRRFATPGAIAAQAALGGGPLTQPTLYLHGSNDGCVAVSPAQVARAQASFGPGSVCEYVEGVGHFMLVEAPAQLTPRIVDFLRAGRGG